MENKTIPAAGEGALLYVNVPVGLDSLTRLHLSDPNEDVGTKLEVVLFSVSTQIFLPSKDPYDLNLDQAEP